MNCRLELRSLSLHQQIAANRSFFLSIIISDKHLFRTIEHRSVQKRIPICEQMEVELDEELQLYIQIDIYELLGVKQQLMESKVFYSAQIQKIHKHQFHIITGSEKTQVKLDCVIYINNAKVSEENKNLLEKIDMFGKRLKQQIHDIKEQTPMNNLEIIKLGEQSFRFANRLDNLVRLKNVMIAYRDWVSPSFTLGMTFSLSLLIFSPVITIFLLCSIALIFRQSVINILTLLSNNLQFPQKRLIIPPSNVMLLRQAIDQYCSIFDSTKAVLADPEKAQIRILLARFISKLWIPIFILCVFSIREILVIGLWIFVLNRHYRASQVTQSLFKLTTHFFNKIQSKLPQKQSSAGMVFSSIIARTEVQELTVKTLFVYEYERQWFGVFSNKDSKILDESGYVKLSKEKFPHPDYEWLDQWKVVIGAETDTEGYTYSADFVNKYHKERSLMDALRRRKWVRKYRKLVAKEVGGVEEKSEVASQEL